MKKNILILMVVIGQAWTGGCNNAASAVAPRVRHHAEIEKYGSILFVDRVESKQVIKELVNGKESGGAFATYKIGISNPFSTDSKRRSEWSIYFEYNMQKDWVAMLEGDSLSAVFFHPVIGLNGNTKEAILVFELPTNAKEPDTLVYNDSFGSWQKQIIPLNQNHK